MVIGAEDVTADLVEAQHVLTGVVVDGSIVGVARVSASVAAMALRMSSMLLPAT